MNITNKYTLLFILFLSCNSSITESYDAKVFIDEWYKEIAIMLEEDAFFDGDQCTYIDPRQTEMIEIDWEI